MPVTTPVRPEEHDPTVRAAAGALAEALRDSETATAAWEAAALAGWQARARRAGRKQLVSVDGTLIEAVPSGVATKGDLRRLANAEAEAEHNRRAAAERVVTARMRLEEARARARRTVSVQ